MKGNSSPNSFLRLNRITGWIVGLFACTVYILTMEPTGSFWDCGEFVSSCYKLQIPHPPGAPLFILLGRFFIVLFGDSPHTAARGVNFMSAIASGLSILFLFWTITHFARKITANTFTILATGVIGALAYTFCDSFWYSAVEGEVYATSAFFTAIVFWAILKWEEQADKPHADRWLIFIFYMMGLSIGVHLLNLLTIPAIVMVYYFKRYKPTRPGTFLAFLAGCALTGIVQVVVIQYTIKGAGAFDVFFVNSLNLPFFSGFASFFVLLAIALILGIRYAIKKNYHLLKIGLWSASFMLLGYSTYFTTMIRSNADPGVDMFNVDNPVSLVGYLSREQYSDWPIVYGPDFTDPAPTVEAGDSYVKGPDEYEIAGKKYAQDWAHTPSSHFFPRMYNPSNLRSEVDTYKRFSGMDPDAQPTMADNIKYFLRYQTGWMYLRYFMWNFAGKQNDLQGFGNPRDSNWVSGISALDNLLYGDQSKLPDTAHKNNKAYNRLYLLPLLLGLLGLILQYRRNRRDTLVTGLLFFFTGFAIVIYLNQAGLQPRERDYAFAGSFYVFAIWIGLGVIGVQEFLQHNLPRLLPRFFPVGPPAPSPSDHFRPSVAGIAAATLCLLAVPVLMGTQEWDDHDRSKKTLARDLAVDYLESCPKNAILFSFEDNDTYPIWYAQEVEGIRPDVRVIINTLSGTDWLINQLRYKINDAPPIDVLFTKDQIMGDKKEVVYFTDKLPGWSKDKYYDLYDTFKTVLANDDPRFMTETEGGTPLNLLPTRKFSVPVNAPTVLANGTVHSGEKIVPELDLDINPQKNYLEKNELTMLAIIAANRWKRPICFTNPNDPSALGLGKYIRSRGMSYQLVPVPDTRVDLDVAYRTVMQKFQYGHAGTPGVYFDGDNRRYLNSIKMAHAEIAQALIDAGRKEDARRILEHYDQNVNPGNFPYGFTSYFGNMEDRASLWFLDDCYAAGDLTLAARVEASLTKDLQQQMRYYQSLGDGGSMTDEQLAINARQASQGKPNTLSDRQLNFASDILSTYQILMQISTLRPSSRGSAPSPI
ncbi:MAG TPA: DUF2723 domain-containing protein [Puia sp.]|nr:DUF2723 domain-containing protein [Puia sp.]